MFKQKNNNNIKLYGLQGTEQTRETQEKIKAIYFVNENEKITKVLTNENDK